MDSMIPTEYQDEEDARLWDELNQQHHQEMIQHHTRSRSLAQRFLNQASTELSRYTSVFYHAAADAWKEQKERQEYRSFRFGTVPPHRQGSGDDDQAMAYLEDLGIPTAGEDGASRSQYVSLVDQVSAPFRWESERRQRQNDRNRQTDAARGVDDDDLDAFVMLPRFRLLPQAEGWGAVSNLDWYFSSLYSYFYHGGMSRIVAQGIVQLVTLVFTLFLSVFLFVYVDWGALTTCVDETSCRGDLGEYLNMKPFSHWSLWKLWVATYCLLFSLYTIVSALSFLNALQDAWHARWVFQERLGISARRLQGGAVDWDRDIVAKLVQLQQSGEYRVAIHGSSMDALVIANRIMRKENFLVAMFNQPELFDFSAPVPFVGDQLFCSSLEWSLYFCVLNFMFNRKFQIRPAFYLDPSALRRRFWLCGMAHLVFMPFLLFFMTLYFGFQNLYDWKNSKTYLGPKDWAKAAKWKFREFNELPHNFERRLEPSYQAAHHYLKLFGNNEVLAAIGQITVFIGGSLGAVLLAFAALNDAILLHVKVADWNLLWFAGVFGALYSVGKALVPSDEARPSSSRNLFEEMEKALEEVSVHTHFYPDSWKRRGWDEAVYASFSNMFQFKAKLFAMEIISLIAAPYILCVSLPNCAERLCEFVLATKAQVQGAGDVCSYATFDYSICNDEGAQNDPEISDRGTPTETLTESILRTGNAEMSIKRFPVPKAKNEKMRRSLEGFQSAHPSFASGRRRHPNEMVTDPTEEAESHLAPTNDAESERDHHLEAANRQLETLAVMEDEGNSYSSYS